MRVPQKIDGRGSLKWLQRLLTYNPSLLSDGIRSAAGRSTDWRIEWVSPRQDDDWAEYRDGSFLEVLGLEQHRNALSQFWPSRGPQWDALGRSSERGAVLLEAKAHVSELSSTCAAGKKSLTTIEKSLNAAKAAFAAPASAEWLAPYYQYANRLAHLHFLRELGIPSVLAFLYFVGDQEMGGPISAEEWRAQLGPVYTHLGLTGDLGDYGVCNIFITVNALRVA